MLRVINNSPVFILLLWLLVEDKWLHGAKEHNKVEHFREGGGGCAGY